MYTQQFFRIVASSGKLRKGIELGWAKKWQSTLSARFYFFYKNLWNVENIDSYINTGDKYMGCYFISFSIFSILNIVPDKIKNKKGKRNLYSLTWNNWSLKNMRRLIKFMKNIYRNVYSYICIYNIVNAQNKVWMRITKLLFVLTFWKESGIRWRVWVKGFFYFFFFTLYTSLILLNLHVPCVYVLLHNLKIKTQIHVSFMKIKNSDSNV